MAGRGQDTLYWLHTDHLGSTSEASTATASLSGQERYFPYGQVRYSSGSIPTTYNYTGQRLDGTGLLYYGARYYHPLLGRFVQADTIVPQPGNPQSLNRYSYTLNNPLKYIDPSGHEEECTNDACWEAQWYLSHGYKWSNKLGEWIYTGQFDLIWIEDDDTRRTMILEFAQALANNNTPAGEALARITAYAAAFYESLGAAAVAFTYKFVDDVSNVLTGMAGPDILQDLRNQTETTNPYFVQQHKFADTDLYPWYRDGTANQAYHFWFYVALSYWNGPIVAEAGNLYHELSPSQPERSLQDYLLGEAGIQMGTNLARGVWSIFSVSSIIRQGLIPPWYW